MKDTNSSMFDDNNPQTPSGSRKRRKLLWILAAAGLLGFNAYLLSKVNKVQEAAQTRQAELEQQVGDLEELLARREHSHLRQMEGLEEKLRTTSVETDARSRGEAKRQADRLSQTIAKKQHDQQEMFLDELGRVRSASDETKQGLVAVGGELEQVRSGLDATRASLNETSGMLVETQGAMERIDGQIDEHASEIARLRTLGARTIVTFELPRAKERTHVADVQLRLKGVSPGKNRYTIEVLSDDDLVTYKDRRLREPVEFYVDGAPKPYEIVVTRIDKDKVTGYLSKPKALEMARN